MSPKRRRKTLRSSNNKSKHVGFSGDGQKSSKNDENVIAPKPKTGLITNIEQTWTKYIRPPWMAAYFILTTVGWFVWGKECMKSPEQKYHETNFIEGLLIPDEILNKNIPLKIQVGSDAFLYSISDLERGIQFQSVVCTDSIGHKDIISNRFKILNNKLYLSDTINYLLNGEYIASLNYNAIEIYLPNRIKCYTDSKNLEIVDKQLHVVISLSFINSTIVSLQGYSVKNNVLNVYYPGGAIICTDINDKKGVQKAVKYLELVKARYPQSF